MTDIELQQLSPTSWRAILMGQADLLMRPPHMGDGPTPSRALDELAQRVYARIAYPSGTSRIEGRTFCRVRFSSALADKYKLAEKLEASVPSSL